MDAPENTTTTVARFIRRFREDEPNSRDARKALQEHCWWVRSQEDDLLKRSPRPNASQHRPCTKPGDEGVSPPLPQPHRGEVQSEHGGTTFNQSSPLARPLCDISPRHPLEGEPVALELMKNTSQKEGQTGLLGVEAGHDTETFVQDEPVRAYGGESDELAYLDARAHSLLEHCRQLLAPSSAPSDQVSTSASADLEERAWTLFTDYKRSRDRPCTPEAQSNPLSIPFVAKASIGEDSTLSSGGCFGERGNLHRYQQEHGHQSGNVRPVHNVSLAPETDKYSALMTSCPHDIDQPGDGSKHDRTLLGSIQARSNAEEWMDWRRDDPVLSVLLRRCGEIEAEIERRRFAKLKWRRPNGGLGKSRLARKHD